jgi:hypothetical protein
VIPLEKLVISLEKLVIFPEKSTISLEKSLISPESFYKVQMVCTAYMAGTYLFILPAQNVMEAY